MGDVVTLVWWVAQQTLWWFSLDGEAILLVTYDLVLLSLA